MKAAQYIRVSSEQQRHSLSAQSAQIAAFAAARGYEIIASYEDRGRSGLHLKGRPALQRLLADVISGQDGFSAVLVQDVSRWGRFQDPDEAAHYEYVCRAAGVEVCYCGEPFEALSGRVGDIIKAMKRLMAADFSRELSVKVRNAQQRHAQEGYKMGGLAGYGLRRAVIDEAGEVKALLEAGQQRLVRGDRIRLTPGPPHEVKTVRRIFRMYLEEGLGLRAIADQLNREGIAAERGRPWGPWAIGNLLENPKYAGVYRYGRRPRTLDGRRVSSAPQDMLQVSGACPPIVPLAWIDAAVARRRRRMLFLPRDEILRRLHAHVAANGPLTRAAVAASADLPSPHACRAHLGPWRRIRARVGLYPPFLPGQIDKPRGLAEAGVQEDRAMPPSYTAFIGTVRLATGDLETVALAAHGARDRQAEMPIVFDDASGGVVDLDLRGDPKDVVSRLRTAETPAQAEGPRPRGRPKLGVTAREVTLLPKHWTWLQEQPGGASAALRRLVEQAQQGSAEADRTRNAQTATYRVMYALAGHLAGYEDALRALYGGQAQRFEALIAPWPADVAAYVRRLAVAAF